MGQNREPDERSIALDVRAASQDVYAGWSAPDGDRDTGERQQRAIEAHVAAAVTGRKPLYFDPWGEEFSEAFVELVSDPDSHHAASFARLRAEDFELAFGWQDLKFTLEMME